MADKRFATRLKVSIALTFMLLSQLSFQLCGQPAAGSVWQQLDILLENKLPDLGGRAVMLVWKDGKIQYSKTLNNLSNKQEMIGKRIAKKQGRDANDFTGDFTLDSRQRIASSSKWLTAALLMSFVDEGKLALEDSIGKYLPVMTAHGKGGIKIWQCLSHLTGIRQVEMAGEMNRVNSSAGSEIGGGRQTGRLAERRALIKSPDGRATGQNRWPSMAAAMDSIAIQPMEGEPGKTFHYGNAGLQIAAAIVEKISGKTFNQAFTERIAKPLGMQHSDFGNSPVPLAAGGAFSTPNDYMKFLQMILQKGQFEGRQIISEASINAMQENRIGPGVKIIYSPAEAGNWGYGFGEWTGPATTQTDGSPMPASTFISSPGLFGSFPWIDNSKQYAAFLFVTNLKTNGRHQLYQDLKQAVEKGLGD